MSRISTHTDLLSDMKSQFLASLNYEVRTPLTGILGMLDLLLETDLTEEQKEYAESSRLCADSLLDLMNSTLEFSALSANQVSLENSEFSLPELLETMLGDFASKARSKNLSFTWNLERNLPEVAVGDAIRLRQVLGNIVDNAVKFTHRGGIEVGVSTSALNEGRRMLSFSVRDTGIGIASDKLDCIFDSFRQGETGIARKYPGMGLGLAVTQKLAKLMRANINVTSEVEKGSTFLIDIPMQFSRETRINAA